MMEVTATSFTITCAILCVIVSFVMRYSRRRRLCKLAAQFEGPPALPLIGNAHLFIGSTEDNLKRMSEIVSSYPTPSRFWIAHQLYIAVTDPEQIKTIFVSSKSIDKGYMFEFVKPFVGSALAAAPGPEWRVHRKLIQPNFNTKILNNYVKVFYTQSKIFVNKIERNLDGPEFEIFDPIVLATLDMLCETLMDTEIKAQTTSKGHPYVEALKQVTAITSKRVFSIWLYPDFIFHRTQLGRDQRRSIKTMRDFSDEGHDTTAISLSFVILMLASHPEVQWTRNLFPSASLSLPRFALFAIYGEDDEREVTHEDLGRMTYLDNVIKETMRLFPVFPLLVRAVKEDLDIGDHTLPEGSEAIIPILGVHRNEKYWPEPLKFNPDRFLPEEVAKRHPYSYLAFSGGPRNCIGMKYAMMVMKTLVATVLRRYTLTKDNIVPPEDIRLKMEIMTKPVHPIAIKIKRRVCL